MADDSPSSVTDKKDASRATSSTLRAMQRGSKTSETFISTVDNGEPVFANHVADVIRRTVDRIDVNGVSCTKSGTSLNRAYDALYGPVRATKLPRRLYEYTFMTLWMMFITLAHVILVPARIAFVLPQVNDLAGASLVAWMLVELFALDTPALLDFWNAHRHIKQASRLRSLVRAASALPFDVFCLIGAAVNAKVAFKLWAFARLLKMLQLARLFEYVHLLDRIGSADARAGRRCLYTIGAGLLMAHVLACVWHGLGTGEGLICDLGATSAAESWAQADPGLCLDASCATCISLPGQYVRSLYWAMTTISTVGYGDIVPKSLAETTFAVVAELFGIALYVILLSSVTSFISNKDAARLAYNRKVHQLTKFCHAYGVADQVGVKVLRYFELVWQQSHGFEEDLLLEQLPRKLRSNVVFALYGHVLTNAAVFESVDANMARLVFQDASILTFLSGENIYRRGQKAESFFGICRGIVWMEYDDVTSAERISLEASPGVLLGHNETLARTSYVTSTVVKSPGLAEIFCIEWANFLAVAQYYVSLETFREICEQSLEIGDWMAPYSMRGRKRLSPEDVDKIRVRMEVEAKQANTANRSQENFEFKFDTSQNVGLSSFKMSRARAITRPSSPSSAGSAQSLGHEFPIHRQRSRDASSVVDAVVSEALIRKISNLELATDSPSTRSLPHLIAALARLLGTFGYLIMTPLLVGLRAWADARAYRAPILALAYGIDALFLLDFVTQAFRLRQVRAMLSAGALRKGNRRLVMDALSLAPVDIVALVASSSPNWRLWAAARTIRCIRMLRLQAYSRRVATALKLHGVRVGAARRSSIQLAAFSAICCTWLAALWALLSQENLGIDRAGAWAAVADSSATTIHVLERSFYWAVMTLTTVGYGDISAISVAESVYSIVAILLASLGLYPIIVANISVLQGEPSESGRICSRVLMDKPSKGILVERTKACKLISSHETLAAGLRAYLTHVEEQDFDPQEIFAELPPWLARKVAYELYGSMLRGNTRCEDSSGGRAQARVMPFGSPQRNLSGNKLFQVSSSAFLAEICVKLRVELGIAHSTLVTMGQEASHAYFLVDGLVQAYENGQKGFGGPGSYFGFEEIVRGASHSATVQVLEQTMFLCISAADFHRALQLFPEDASSLETACKPLRRRPSDLSRSLNTQSSGSNVTNTTGTQGPRAGRRRSKEAPPMAAGMQHRRCSDANVTFHASLFTHVSQRKYAILPLTSLRRNLETAATAIALGVHLLIPLGIGTVASGACSLSTDRWIGTIMVLNGLGDVYSAFDMILHAFFFAIREKGVLIIEARTLWKRYARSHGMLIDAVATFPVDWIYLAASGSSGSLHVVMMLRLFKLVRLLELPMHLGRLSQVLDRFHVKQAHGELTRLFLILLVFAHWLTCIWMRFANANPIDSWAASDCALSGSCFTNDTVADLRSVAQPESCSRFNSGMLYLRGLYWVLVTLNTVGFGDVVAKMDEELIFVILVMVLGAAMYALLIAILASIVANLDLTATKHKRWRENLQRFIQARELPQSLRDKILSYADQMWRLHRGGSLEEVVRFLPRNMQTDLLKSLDDGQLAKVSLFQSVPQILVDSLISRLTPVVCAPGDFVFRAGQPSSAMYILCSGEVTVLAEDGVTTVAKFSGKGVFGFDEFFEQLLMNTSLIAHTFCTVLVLRQEEVLESLDQFPGAEAIILANVETLKATSTTLKLANNLKNRKVTKMMTIDSQSLRLKVRATVQPDARWRVVWELFMLALTIYVVAAAPFRVGILAPTSESRISERLLIWSMPETVLVNGMFFMDMRLHATRFAFFREGSLVSEPSELWPHYKTTWFRLDLLASIPWEILVMVLVWGVTPSEDLSTTVMFRWWSLGRLPTVLRLRRVGGYYYALLDFYLHIIKMGLSAAVMRIIFKVFSLLLLAHWVACAWYAVASWEGLASSWAHGELGQLDQGSNGVSAAHVYLRSLYWSITVLTTIGYGDIVPKTMLETLLAVLLLLTSLYIYVDIVANVTTLISNIDSSAARQKTIREAVRRSLRAKETPPTIMRTVNEFLDSQTLLARFGISEPDLLRTLPDSMQREILSYMHEPRLSEARCFRFIPQAVLSEIAAGMEHRTLVTGDTLGCEGSVAMKLALLTAGSMQFVALKFGLPELPTVDSNSRSSVAARVKSLTLDSRVASSQSHASALDESHDEGSEPSAVAKEDELSGSQESKDDMTILGQCVCMPVPIGSLIGIEIFCNQVMSATAVALSISEAYVVPHTRLDDLMSRLPVSVRDQVRDQAMAEVTKLQKRKSFRPYTADC